MKFFLGSSSLSSGAFASSISVIFSVILGDGKAVGAVGNGRASSSSCHEPVLNAPAADVGTASSLDELRLSRKESSVGGAVRESDGAAGADRGDQACENLSAHCRTWADKGYCKTQRANMRKKCRKACFECIPDRDSKLDIGVAQRAEGTKAKETLALIDDMTQYMWEEVLVKPEYQSVRVECRNRNDLCAFWAVTGECEKNPDWMTIHCAPACRSCDKIDMRNRCPLDPDAKDALGPGDLNKMFERISTSTQYAVYKPVVHFRPSYPAGLVEGEVNYQLGPWVMSFENFLTAEECETLIKLGDAEGYERSHDIGKQNFDGTYTAHRSERRTSENAWCENTCYEHPVVQRIALKIANLTGIPEANSEYLQLLKYEEGQFYQPHNDYIPQQKERQPGPRMLTLLLYLNDVEKGGSTSFPYLDNFTIVPKRGRALLWPSVQDANPNEMDHRTLHQALPVTKGIKYASNAWLHQRDFKGPMAADCH